MFYSQFILAKKGPLGTIWIAAHLERKLRKNQVADTDIGDSVDSILCPDVPIALRLSSHLLLGVVRIYSRKVNYLFDDCSEALLKIKQAFRSTAVDLPPEESKAPYNSITLPETFDLDDFELPDNDIFQGNFVDHHISSREQITLQDNMEGVVYSTSQFGLDERFGDGDTSGLDLDEELLMGKIDVAGHSGLSADPQASVHSMTPLKLDEDHQGMPANPETVIEDVNEDADLMDYAQAPRTPGLVEEPNLSNVQETSACDDHIESEDNHLMESAVKENLENTFSRSNLHQGNEHMVGWSIPIDTNTDVAPFVPCEENGFHSSDLGIKPGVSPSEVNTEDMSSNDHAVAGVGVVCQGPKLADDAIAISDSLNREKESRCGNVKIVDDVPSFRLSHDDHGEITGVISEGFDEGVLGSASSCLQVTEGGEKSNNMNNNAISERPSSPRDGLEFGAELLGTSGLERPESIACVEPKNSQNSNLVLENGVPCDQIHVLRSCNAELGELDSSHAVAEHSVDLEPSDRAALPLETSKTVEILQASGDSTVVQGEICNSVDDSGQSLKENHTTVPASLEDIHAGSGNLKSSGDIDLPAPEKLLSVPEGFGDRPRSMLMEVTPGDVGGVDESDAGSRIVSGKKRSYTESTLTEQSLNSVESSRAVRTKKTVEAVPDDDDLLSSILVGRKSSVLKMKPTPPPSEITSLKRHRSAPRTSTSKRKVLMDDTMVLHGDTIRQQLMNTEDIRRLRKKAPCTRPEIAMIQKQFLEDEIFGDSIFSGVSICLACLHNQRYDISGITICKNEENDATLTSATDLKLTSVNEENAENLCIENTMDSSGQQAVASEIDGGGVLATARDNGEMQPAQTCELNDNKVGEDCDPNMDDNSKEVQMKTGEDLVLAEPEHFQNLAETEIDGDIGDMDRVQTASLDKRSEMDDLLRMDELLLSSDEKRQSECVGVDNSAADGVIGKVNDDNDDTYKADAFVVSLETEASVGDGFSLDAIQGGATAETERDTNCLVLENNAFGSSIEMARDMDGRVETNDQICDGIVGERPIISTSSARENVSWQAATFHEVQHPMQHGSYGDSTVDPEISLIDAHDREDLNYSATANDTEFLNFDDDEVAEVTDDYTPNAEEIRFIENSGWSTRTRCMTEKELSLYCLNNLARGCCFLAGLHYNGEWVLLAVAKYLQTVFVKEAECGKKAFPMDNLLIGKTRKEASRMFFETLVLKTRDYIHVEQERPFGNVTLKPRTKLFKSDY
ncbi:sister chromatid cohesion 1 protein 4-like isoform X3 [Coffea arabica]|uniref:Sister chromatid cohesion 1 protein 4-like isoform X3 n=1 Tax=Coffea arabica TaxID=13443 RepID=A0ABM4VQ70_COFAR